MAFVQFSRVSLAFGGQDILREVSLNLAAGSRAALTGANGSGKSTLMKVIAGKLAPDSGGRAVQKGCRISYLPQAGITQEPLHRERTLREEAELAFGEIAALLGELDGLGRRLEQKNADSGGTAALLEEYHRLQERIEDSGYYRREARIAVVLSGLGFSKADLDRRTGEFSGGWQMRIALAKVLLERPDILLLDEPTNYLDIEARSWLESWLQSFTGGCLLVSHDRYFLDVTVREVYELFQGNLKRYQGNYSAYEKIRAVELESLIKRYEAQREEIAKSEDLIRRFRYKASKAAMVQERIKKLEKMERIEIPESLKRIHLTFPPPPHGGRVALVLSGLGKGYGDRQVLRGLDLVLESGERLLVAGRNGAGKTSLLRILGGADPDYEGTVSYGAGILPGYFSQEAAEAMTGPERIIEFMEALAPTPLIPRVRDMLGSFLFRDDDVYKPLGVLSGGEKSRLALLRMLLKPMNLLILDEPTNHLDLHSKDILLDTLRDFKGTIVFVSHDRGFMEGLSTKTLELTGGDASAGGRHRLFYGGYAYYLERIEAETEEPAGGGSLPPASSPALRSMRPHQDVSASPSVWASVTPHAAPPVLDNTHPRAVKGGAPLVPPAPETPPGAAARREAEKQKQTLLRRLRRGEEEILKVIEDLETEMARLEADLGRPEVYRDGEKVKTIRRRLGVVKDALEEKGREWEAKAEELVRALGGRI
jgi:ATP-binding cassette subfamily F protein 3